MKSVLSVLTALLFFVGLSVAQNAGTQSSTTTDNQATSTQTQNQTGTAATDQGAAAQQTSPDMNNQTNATGTSARHHHRRAAAASDQNGAAATDNAGANDGNANGKLPQTASPLPLLGLLGMGSLGIGAISRRKRK